MCDRLMLFLKGYVYNIVQKKLNCSYWEYKITHNIGYTQQLLYGAPMI